MERLVFMGTPRFGEIVLGALIGHYEIVAVITQPDREAGRGRLIRVSRVKALAVEHGLCVLQPKRVGNPSAIEQLRDMEPTLIAVAAFGQILPPALLAVPAHGAVNVHASLLPRHRGAAPIPATILAVFLLGLSCSFGFASQALFVLELDGTKTIGQARAIGIYRAIERIGQMMGPSAFGAVIAGAGFHAGISLMGAALLLTVMFFIIGTAKKREKFMNLRTPIGLR